MIHESKFLGREGLKEIEEGYLRRAQRCRGETLSDSGSRRDLRGGGVVLEVVIWGDEAGDGIEYEGAADSSVGQKMLAGIGARTDGEGDSRGEKVVGR